MVATKLAWSMKTECDCLCGEWSHVQNISPQMVYPKDLAEAVEKGKKANSALWGRGGGMGGVRGWLVCELNCVVENGSDKDFHFSSKLSHMHAEEIYSVFVSLAVPVSYFGHSPWCFLCFYKWLFDIYTQKLATWLLQVQISSAFLFSFFFFFFVPIPTDLSSF